MKILNILLATKILKKYKNIEKIIKKREKLRFFRVSK